MRRCDAIGQIGLRLFQTATSWQSQRCGTMRAVLCTSAAALLACTHALLPRRLATLAALGRDDDADVFPGNVPRARGSARARADARLAQQMPFALALGAQAAGDRAASYDADVAFRLARMDSEPFDEFSSDSSSDEWSDDDVFQMLVAQMGRLSGVDSVRFASDLDDQYDDDLAEDAPTRLDLADEREQLFATRLFDVLAHGADLSAGDVLAPRAAAMQRPAPAGRTSRDAPEVRPPNTETEDVSLLAIISATVAGTLLVSYILFLLYRLVLEAVDTQARARSRRGARPGLGEESPLVEEEYDEEEEIVIVEEARADARLETLEAHILAEAAVCTEDMRSAGAESSGTPHAASETTQLASETAQLRTPASRASRSSAPRKAGKKHSFFGFFHKHSGKH